jgi:signal transduction histidine kinase
MLQKLFSGPWPEQGDLPERVRLEASQRIFDYWRWRMWTLLLGEIILWVAGQTKDPAHARVYALPVTLIGAAYFVGCIPRSQFLWLLMYVPCFVMQGMLIKGFGGVTALSLILPYTIASMIFNGRKRILIQACCVVGFWFSLLYDFLPLFQQLEPLRYFEVSYSILLAATTFQGMRFLNTLAIELNTAHVGREVTQRSQQFLARVSHELRTPLNSVLGFAKLLKRSDLPETQASYLTQIVEEGEQLNHLVSDLLDSAQLSTGKLRLTVAPCDVNLICSAVADEIKSLLQAGVGCQLTLGTNIPQICADPLRVRQIVRNLAGNAVKYTAAGKISIGTAFENGRVLVSVSDTGSGIPEAQKALVFVAFVKLDGRSAGIGLGLDIAMQLAKLHGGTIVLDSAAGEGSTFTLELPIKAPGCETGALPQLPEPIISERK